VLVVDHFHVVQLANRAVTEVRRRVTLHQRGRRGRSSDPEWRLRNRLTRSAARMPGQHVDRLTDTLAGLPAVIGTPILAAWNAKEDLLDLLATACTRPDREQISRLLHRFYQRCADSGQPELHRLATTVETWWPQILAFIRTGITNAGSEGTPTGSSKPSPATPTASATPTTNAYAPAAPPPDATADTSTPPKFEEPPYGNTVRYSA
jgi:transposase